jgi:hypothetical protein
VSEQASLWVPWQQNEHTYTQYLPYNLSATHWQGVQANPLKIGTFAGKRSRLPQSSTHRQSLGEIGREDNAIRYLHRT